MASKDIEHSPFWRLCGTTGHRTWRRAGSIAWQSACAHLVNALAKHLEAGLGEVLGGPQGGELGESLGEELAPPPPGEMTSQI